MCSGKRPSLVVFAVVVCLWLLPVGRADAGPILDWLRWLRDSLFPPTTVAYYTPGVTTVQQPVTGTVACDTPVPAAEQRVVVQYVPRTSFRTSWTRIPVTTYRPVTGIDPVTGTQVTYMQPCVAYAWQLRRVPYTTYRPVYRTVTVAPAAVQVAPAPCDGAVVSAPAATVLPGPAAPAPAGQPATTVPSGPGGQPAAEPADVRPSLKPVGPPPAPQESKQSTGPTTSGQGDGAPNSPPPQSTYRPSAVAPQAPGAQPKGKPVVPLPDPDAAPTGPRAVENPPQLLDPGDKTASWPVRRAWSYEPILTARTRLVRPASADAVVQPPAESAAPQVESNRWDAGGWYSLSK